MKIEKQKSVEPEHRHTCDTKYCTHLAVAPHSEIVRPRTGQPEPNKKQIQEMRNIFFWKNTARNPRSAHEKIRMKTQKCTCNLAQGILSTSGLVFLVAAFVVCAMPLPLARELMKGFEH
jgi:hypothetical protein